MTLTERAKAAKEAYIIEQKAIVERNFFDLFGDTPDKVTFTSYRNADIKIGSSTIKATKSTKWINDTETNEDYWYFTDTDSWMSINSIEELGFCL